MSCPGGGGGSGEAQWERYCFGFWGLFRELWACYHADAFDMGASRCAVLYLGGGLSCPLSGMRLFCVLGEWVLGLRSFCERP